MTPKVSSEDFEAWWASPTTQAFVANMLELYKQCAEDSLGIGDSTDTHAIGARTLGLAYKASTYADLNDPGYMRSLLVANEGEVVNDE